MTNRTNAVSPTDSIASNLFSPAESIASSMSMSSGNGPYTPADSLSMNGLTISHADRPAAEGVPEDVEEELPGAELGFGGYSTWSPESMWEQNGELIITDDFNLASIPPIEMGVTMPEQPSGEMEAPYGSLPEEPYNDTSGQDPFASLFSYDMNW